MVKIAIDLEMTCPTRRNSIVEVIEIGAVKLDDNYNIVDTFQTYVRPIYVENIGDKCTQLTGITVNMVDNAPRFLEAINKFIDWIKSPAAILYEWSESDHKQLNDEYCRLTGLPELPPPINTWVNAQVLFNKAFGVKQRTNLTQALNIAGIEFDGREHSALYDAINTARLIAVINDNNYMKSRNAALEKLFNSKNETFGASIGDILKYKLKINSN